MEAFRHMEYEVKIGSVENEDQRWKKGDDIKKFFPELTIISKGKKNDEHVKAIEYFLLYYHKLAIVPDFY